MATCKLGWEWNLIYSASMLTWSMPMLTIWGREIVEKNSLQSNLLSEGKKKKAITVFVVTSTSSLGFNSNISHFGQNSCILVTVEWKIKHDHPWGGEQDFKHNNQSEIIGLIFTHYKRFDQKNNFDMVCMGCGVESGNLVCWFGLPWSQQIWY